MCQQQTDYITPRSLVIAGLATVLSNKMLMGDGRMAISRCRQAGTCSGFGSTHTYGPYQHMAHTGYGVPQHTRLKLTAKSRTNSAQSAPVGINPWATHHWVYVCATHMTAYRWRRHCPVLLLYHNNVDGRLLRLSYTPACCFSLRL